MPPISAESSSSFPLLRDVFPSLVQPEVSIHTFPWVVESITNLRKKHGKLSDTMNGHAVTAVESALWEMWYAILAQDTKVWAQSRYENSLFNGKGFGDGEMLSSFTDKRLGRMKLAGSFCLKYQLGPTGHRSYSAVVMPKITPFKGLDGVVDEIPGGMGGYNVANVGTVGFPACCGTNISYNRAGWRSLIQMTGFSTLFLIWQACLTKSYGWPTMLGVLPKRYYQNQVGRDGIPLQKYGHDNFKDSWWGRTGWRLNSTFINENHKSVLHYVSYDAYKQYQFAIGRQSWQYSRESLKAAFEELFTETIQ
jgi:hypothetical protein